MMRRDFLAAGLGAAAVARASVAGRSDESVAVRRRGSGEKFSLKYAPHLGMFRHHAGSDSVDQLRFMADEGFTAFEDNGMAGRSVSEQERMAVELERSGMTMGVFVASANWGKKTFVHRDAAIRDQLVSDMKNAVQVAKRVHATWCTVLLDSYDPRLDWAYQTANAVENLKYCAEICEPHGLVMVLEPLNWRDHPGLFLTKIPQAYEICRAIGSPSCKILDDLYHQQVTEGNLIPNIDMAWEEIAYFQMGDNPGRKEPTTGEINYANVFQHIQHKGFRGVTGMEHGNSNPGRDGERSVIDAYRSVDPR